jgi:transcriptional regulator with XRE-family HTH domain
MDTREAILPKIYKLNVILLLFLIINHPPKVMEASQTKFNNRLWQARRRKGLEQKQVAYLLGHKSADLLSRYERGARTPNLRTLLKLSHIYAVSVGELFPEHARYYVAEINSKPPLFGFKPIGENINAGVGDRLIVSDVMKTDHFVFEQEAASDAMLCHYAYLLDSEFSGKKELDAIRKHAARLVRTLAYR